MSKVIRITTISIGLVDFPETSDIKAQLEWMYQQIGCRYIETLPTYRFDERYIMVVDEEGKLTHQPWNAVGSWLYGPGDDIVGTVLLMKEKYTDEGPELCGMGEDEAKECLRTIGSLLSVRKVEA